MPGQYFIVTIFGGRMKAKKINLIGKIVGAVVIVLGSALVGLRLLPGLTAIDCIFVGLAVMGVFFGIDINLMLEKFVK